MAVLKALKAAPRENRGFFMPFWAWGVLYLVIPGAGVGSGGRVKMSARVSGFTG